jgi:hypothetical protein
LGTVIAISFLEQIEQKLDRRMSMPYGEKNIFETINLLESKRQEAPRVMLRSPFHFRKQSFFLPFKPIG